MILSSFLANALLAALGAVLLVAVPETVGQVCGAVLLTFNGLCAIFCALNLTRRDPTNNGKKAG